jgi:hypothetical protein
MENKTSIIFFIFLFSLVLISCSKNTSCENKCVEGNICNGSTLMSCNEDQNGCAQWKVIEKCSLGCEGNNCIKIVPQTCYDGIKREPETGIDCGGNCNTECTSDSDLDGIKDSSDNCVDYDEKTNESIYIASMLQANSARYLDSCSLDHKILTEGICENNAYKTLNITCKVACRAGACTLK